MSTNGVQIALTALAHFLPAHATRAHAAAALDIWRRYHAWVLDPGDLPTVLDRWEDLTWPATTTVVGWRDRP